MPGLGITDMDQGATIAQNLDDRNGEILSYSQQERRFGVEAAKGTGDFAYAVVAVGDQEPVFSK